MLNIDAAITADHFRPAYELIAELSAWDAEQSRLLGFDPQSVVAFFYQTDTEVLMREYLPPGGCLLLATLDGASAGCAAFRYSDVGVCEMHHVFVRESFRGRGIARRLLVRLLAMARDAGYRRMRLETATFMKEAHVLYASLGFVSRGAYREIPEIFKPWTLVMERELDAVSSTPHTPETPAQ